MGQIWMVYARTSAEPVRLTGVTVRITWRAKVVWILSLNRHMYVYLMQFF